MGYYYLVMFVQLYCLETNPCCVCAIYFVYKLHPVNVDKQVNKISLKCIDLNIKMYAILIKISYNKQFSLVRLIKSVMIYMCIAFSDFKVMLQCFYFTV